MRILKAVSDEFSLFAVLCLKIWNQMNKLVHDNIHPDASDAVQYAQEFFSDFREAHIIFSKPRPPEPYKEWQPPATGILKANFDASIYGNQVGARAGVGIRNSDGEERKFGFIRCPEIVESLVARSAFRFDIQDLQFQNFLFGGDYLNVMNQLQE